MKIICGIYKITCLLNGRLYIGQSVNCLKRKSFYGSGSKRENQRKLMASINKYGWENHAFEIIEMCERDYLNYYEIYYIWFFNSLDRDTGMNLVPGGRSYRRTDEQKAHHSMVMKGKNKHPRSEEFKRKVSIGNKGKKRSPESIERNRIAQLSLERKLTDDEKNQISIKSKEMWDSDGFKEMHSNAMKAAWTPEKLKNVSIGLKKAWTPEKKEKRSKKYTGENNPFFGKNHTEETIKINRDAHLGKPSKHKGKSSPFKGVPKSEWKNIKERGYIG